MTFSHQLRLGSCGVVPALGVCGGVNSRVTIVFRARCSEMGRATGLARTYACFAEVDVDAHLLL